MFLKISSWTASISRADPQSHKARLVYLVEMLKIVRLRWLSRDKNPTCCSCDAILVKNSLYPLWAVYIFDLDHIDIRAWPSDDRFLVVYCKEQFHVLKKNLKIILSFRRNFDCQLPFPMQYRICHRQHPASSECLYCSWTRNAFETLSWFAYRERSRPCQIWIVWSRSDTSQSARQTHTLQ